MNDANDPLSDEAIEDLLGPLRAATPPDEVRSANRDAIRRALERPARTAWWQRTVAVPMPLAIAASLALVVTAAASLWPAVSDSNIPPRQQSSRVESAAESPGWRITRSYILSIESLAQFQKPLRPETTEDRNDS
jgi:hypothetical protein